MTSTEETQSHVVSAVNAYASPLSPSSPYWIHICLLYLHVHRGHFLFLLFDTLSQVAQAGFEMTLNFWSLTFASQVLG